MKYFVGLHESYHGGCYDCISEALLKFLGRMRFNCGMQQLLPKPVITYRNFLSFKTGLYMSHNS